MLKRRKTTLARGASSCNPRAMCKLVRSESPSKPHALARSTPASPSVSSSSGSPTIRVTRASRAARANGASGLAQTAVTAIPSSRGSWSARTPRPSSPTNTTRPPEPETLGPLFMAHPRRQRLWRSPLTAAVAARGKVFVPHVQRGLHLMFRTTSTPLGPSTSYNNRSSEDVSPS
jgi:hypothetical protein